MPLVKLLTAAALTLSVAVPAAASATARTPARHVKTHPVQQVSITIRSGDQVVDPNFAVAAGVPVRLTVTNYTHEFHSFTSLGLGLSALIEPARAHAPTTTVVRFTPDLVGSFNWDCVICPSGMHGHPHTMGGRIYVIIDPSVFS